MVKNLYNILSLDIIRGAKLFFFIINRIIFFRLLKRSKIFGKSARFYKRGEIKKLIYSTRLNLVKIKLSNFPKLKLGLSDKEEIINSLNIFGEQIELTESVFSKRFDDFEKEMSLHRFVWILDILVKSPSKSNINLIKDYIFLWVNNYDQLSKRIKFESYSICERINSWLFFLCFTHDYINLNSSQIKLLENNIKEQINILLENVEYNGKYTNNHILNNAKAFYISGSLLDLDILKKIGQKIIYTEVPIMFDNGYFTENSSHYQMLYMKSFLEISLVARFKEDKHFMHWVDTQISMMNQHCKMLQSEHDEAKSFPLFGDISPDIRPDWFVGYPFSNQEGKSLWFKLFNYKISDKTNFTKLIKPTYKILRKGNFEVWVWLKKGQVGSHGHHDNGHISLYYKGKPIIFDSGRKEYLWNNKDKSQIFSSGHNIPCCDGLSWDIEANPIFYNNLFFQSKIKLLISKNEAISFHIESWDKKMELKRDVLLSENKFVLKDTWLSTFSISSTNFMINDNHIDISNSIPEKDLNLSIHKLDNLQIITEDSDIALFYGDSSNCTKLTIKNNKLTSIKYTIETNEC
jgi:hypothetical protein